MRKNLPELDDVEICEGATLAQLEALMQDAEIPAEMAEIIVRESQATGLIIECPHHPGRFLIPNARIEEVIVILDDIANRRGEELD